MRNDYSSGDALKRTSRLSGHGRKLVLALGVLLIGAAVYDLLPLPGAVLDDGNSSTQATAPVDIPLIIPEAARSEAVFAETKALPAASKPADEAIPQPAFSPIAEPQTKAITAATSPQNNSIKEATASEKGTQSNPNIASNAADETEAAAAPVRATTSSTASEEPPASNISWRETKVKKGDSLARIFSRMGLSASLLHRIVNSSKEAKELARIRPGEILKVKIDDQGNLLELIHQRNPVVSLQILPEGDSFTTRTVRRNLEKRINHASGVITNSLYEGAKRAGLSDELIMELANIFGWDIDFALEIRAGDHFSLIYEEAYLDGKKYDNGPILAAEFVNRGRVFRAIRYEDDQGNSNYFSADGHSMRKAFLRAPVDFRRISSRFTKARWHPVLGKKRPHRGVDYSAATGTPIKAAGDGRVIFRGRKGGYGNTVIIKHGSQYTTLYAHMSRFNRKVKKGSRVRQGQIIGYVGKSGLATGPHLHYEFRVNGVHRNPLTVKLPAAAPIARKYRKDFLRKSAPLLEQLELITSTVVADAQQANQ